MKFTLLTALLVLAPAAALAGRGADAGPDALAGRATAKVIYQGATVFSADHPVPRPNMAIVVEGERIATVKPVSALTEADRRGATVRDETGLFALPGLIDTHEHLATQPDRPYAEAQLKRDIYAGVTVVRDMAGDARFLADLSRAARINAIPAPDVIYSALMAGPSFFADPRTASSSLGAIAGHTPWMQAIDASTNLPLAVAQARGTSASGIKIYANLDGPTVRAILAEARRQDFPVWTHLAVYPATPYDVLGARSVSHVCMLARFVLEPNKQRYGHQDEPDYAGFDPKNPEIVRYGRALAAAGTVLDTTLSVYPAEALAGQAKTPCTRTLAGALTRVIADQGARISTGVDTDGDPDDAFPAVYGEIQSLVRYAHFTPAEALTAATLNGALASALERDYGTLEPGKYANIVFTTRDPTADVANLRSVALTVKRGVAFPRADYHPARIPESPQ